MTQNKTDLFSFELKQGKRGSDCKTVNCIHPELCTTLATVMKCSNDFEVKTNGKSARHFDRISVMIKHKREDKNYKYK